MKGVNIFLADGFEDVEAIATFDVLRRGGVNVRFVALGDEPFVTSSHGVTLAVETSLAESDKEINGTSKKDVMIFPGGMPGSKKLAANRELISLMNEHYAASGTLAAICAAPGLVLSQLDGLDGLEFTCFDGFQDALIDKGAIFKPQSAISSGRIITGRSAAYAIPFGLEILRLLKGDEVVESVRKAMYLC